MRARRPPGSAGGYTLVVVVMAAVMLAWFMVRTGNAPTAAALFGASRDNRP